MVKLLRNLKHGDAHQQSAHPEKIRRNTSSRIAHSRLSNERYCIIVDAAFLAASLVRVRRAQD